MHNFIISNFSDIIDENVDVQFKTLQKLGIKYFEPRVINNKNIDDLTDDEVFNLLTVMKKYGIRASCIASQIGKIGLRDNFDAHFEKFKRVVDIAKALGTEYIRVFSFYMPENDNPNKYFGEIIWRLVKMITYAKSQNIVLLHENEKGIYGDTLERCLKLFDALYSSNFKAVFNSSNFIQCGDDPKESFDKIYPYISYIHIKDEKADGSIVPAGCSEENLEYILKTLKEKDFWGFLSLEPDGIANLETDNTIIIEDEFGMAYNSLTVILKRI